MNKKFLRGIAAALAAVMMMPTAAWASGTEGAGDGTLPISESQESEYITPTSKFKINKVTDKLYDGGDYNKIQLTLNENVDPAKVSWVVTEGGDYVSVDSNGLVTSKGLLGSTASPKIKVRATYDNLVDPAKSVYTDYITVNKRALVANSMTVTPTLDIQQKYTDGDSFNTDGIEVHVKYTDKADAIELSANEYKITPETLSVDTTEVTISYEYNGDTLSVTMPVKVEEPAVDTVESISIINPDEEEIILKKDESLDKLKLEVNWKLDGIQNVTINKGDTLPDGMEILGYRLGDKLTKDSLLKVTYNGKESQTLTLKIDTIDSISIVDPYEDEIVVEKKATIDKLTILVEWESGATENITVSKNQTLPSGMKINGYTLGKEVTKDTIFNVTYKEVTSESISLKLEEAKTAKLLKINLLSEPTKVKYREGQTLDLTGLQIERLYDDATTSTYKYSSTNKSSVSATRTTFDKEGTYDVAVTYKEGDFTGVVSFTVTVEHVVDVTGLATGSSSYKLNKDAKLVVGSDLEWDEIFDEVTIKYTENSTSKTKVITNPSELEAFLSGAKLHLEVEDRVGDNDADTIEAGDLNSNGDVELLLWLEYADKEYKGSSNSYDFTMAVEESECTVQLRRSSSSVEATAVFGSFKDAIAAIEDEDDIDNNIGDDLGSNTIYIRLGEDQKYTGTFKPDYDNRITIDLNGHELKLNSEWIEYVTSNAKLDVVITNTESEDAKLTYLDEEITLTVEEDETFTFSKGEIPGIYTITVKSGITNGKVKADKETVGHGGKVEFTITPNSGYEISDVKVDSKSVLKSDDYEVDSKGVATYTVEEVDDDLEITATFKKVEEKKEETKKEETSSSSSNWDNPFTDVSKNAQYYDAVAFVCEEGLFNGMTATKFEPMTTMTRAMFVTVLGRLADVNPQRYSGTSFTDVSKTDQQISWAAPYIEWAVQNGITQGTGNGKFSPNDPITHQQMYLFMYRYAMFVENMKPSITGTSLSSLRDASEIADWALDGVKFASQNNILITSGGKLTPADNALRCELAMLLEGFCKKVLDYGAGR